MRAEKLILAVGIVLAAATSAVHAQYSMGGGVTSAPSGSGPNSMSSQENGYNTNGGAMGHRVGVEGETPAERYSRGQSDGLTNTPDASYGADPDYVSGFESTHGTNTGDISDYGAPDHW